MIIRQFKTTLNGYDKDEVLDYLNQVDFEYKQNYAQLIHKIEELNIQNKELSIELAQLKVTNMELTSKLNEKVSHTYDPNDIANAIIKTQKICDDMINDTKEKCQSYYDNYVKSKNLTFNTDVDQILNNYEKRYRNLQESFDILHDASTMLSNKLGIVNEEISFLKDNLLKDSTEVK